MEVLHPWVPAGRVFALGHWNFADFEFQVLQRKNPNSVEAFTDILFVRQGTNKWQAFGFHIQDDYSPKVRLEEKGSQVIVYREGEIRGYYEMTNQTFRYNLTNPLSLLPPCYIDGEPPTNWWQKSS